MNLFRKLDKIQAGIERWIIICAIFGMTLILLANVFARTIGNSLTFAEELGQFFIIIVTFIGLSYCARRGRHLKMTAIVEFLPFKVRKILVLIITATTSLLLFYLFYLSADYTITLYQLGRVTAALRFPVYLITLFIPIGFFFSGVQYLREFWLNYRYKDEMIDGTEDPTWKREEADIK
ncbi:TRAP transporter small permease [Sediminibacillus albus]|nr:TRAP transporter small permease subunit [Sediminibacillus albus]